MVNLQCNSMKWVMNVQRDCEIVCVTTHAAKGATVGVCLNFYQSIFMGLNGFTEGRTKPLQFNNSPNLILQEHVTNIRQLAIRYIITIVVQSPRVYNKLTVYPYFCQDLLRFQLVVLALLAPNGCCGSQIADVLSNKVVSFRICLLHFWICSFYNKSFY